jgi:hypothetical protein
MKINVDKDKYTICEHCGEETLINEIEECIICEGKTCPNCCSQYGSDIHEDCNLNEECDGDCDCCEDTICYNDNCEKWDAEDHFGQIKSEWDEELEFRLSLDPNDPADAWYFED